MRSITSLQVLDKQHQEQERLLAALSRSLQSQPPDLSEALGVLLQLDENLHEHFQREEEELFPLLHSVFREDERLALDQLTREHVEVLLELSILLLALQQVPPPPDLSTRLLDFIDFFENHSRLEHHLVEEFFRRSGV